MSFPSHRLALNWLIACRIYRLLIPKENQTLTFVLIGTRAPRPARTAFGEKGPERGTIIEKAEPYGQESYDYAIQKLMQRDVDVEFDSTDKSGGFIGALYISNAAGGKDNAAVELVREGLAFVHSYSADSLSWANHLYEAEVCSVLQEPSARLTDQSFFNRTGSGQGCSTKRTSIKLLAELN